MNTHDLTMVTSGAILFGYLLIGFFFWSFWSKTRARLFVFFSVAFWLLALERVMLLWGGTDTPDRPLIYVTRLIAFSIIIAAIWDANRRERR